MRSWPCSRESPAEVSPVVQHWTADAPAAASTGPSALDGILTATDYLSAGADGTLCVDGCDAGALLEQFGSPLFVISERTLRHNYRRFRAAVVERWPWAPVNVLYAIKANNNLAVRAVMAQEGAGGDCFGEGELYATFAGGADPDRVVLNGSNKGYELLQDAVEANVRVNIDGEDEIGFLGEIAQKLGATARVNLRVRAIPDELGDQVSDYTGAPIVQKTLDNQWGFSAAHACELVERIRRTPGLELEGYHHHLGRLLPGVEFHRTLANSLMRCVQEIFERTGFAPKLLDVGGGFPRQRDPESRQLRLDPTPIEEYIEAVTGELAAGFDRLGLPKPALWLEPGRFLAGNGAVLLGTVGEVKRDFGRTWVHADFSINNLMRIETSRSAYHVLAASRLTDPPSEDVKIVGSLCTGSPIARDYPMPKLHRGDVLAVLDAGMYAETVSTQLNGVPRPATVLVNDATAELIKERETVLDVFARHRIPTRLRLGIGPADATP